MPFPVGKTRWYLPINGERTENLKIKHKESARTYRTSHLTLLKSHPNTLLASGTAGAFAFFRSDRGSQVSEARGPDSEGAASIECH